MSTTRRLIPMLVIAMAAGPAAAEPISLVCKGWMPFYSEWAKPMNPQDAADQTTFRVLLDSDQKRIEMRLPHVGGIVGGLKVTDEFYSSSVSVSGKTVGATEISSLDVTMNRYSAKAMMIYVRASDGAMLVAFEGECAPGKVRF